MTDFGGRLRQERERRGIPLRQIAANTKISISALEALERNDTSKLPGGLFSRGFIRSYAAEVGLDPEQTVREFLARFETAPAAARTPASVASSSGSEFERSRHAAARVFVVAVVAMMAVSAIVSYFVLRGRPESLGSPPLEAARSVAGDETRPAGTTGVDERRAALPGVSATMRIELHPTGPCWISVTADGRRVVSRTFQAGDRQSVDVRNLAVITVGEAGAFAFSIDGRPTRPVGRPGEVRTLRISRETLATHLR